MSTLGVVQRFLRSSQNREEERVVHLKHFDTITTMTKRLGEFSDEDDLQEQKSSHVKDTQKVKLTEFGGSFGAFLILFTIPISVIALHTICNETLCSFTKTPNYKQFTSFTEIFDASSLLGLFSFVIILAILSALPFGGRKISALPSKHGKFVYVMNGLFSFFLLSTTALALEFYGIKITEFIVDHIFHLLVSSILVGLIVSLYVYIRSFYVPISALNLHAVGWSGLYAFVLGRELNPRSLSTVDLKLLFFRAFVIGTVSIVYLHNDFKYFIGDFTVILFIVTV